MIDLSQKILITWASGYIGSALISRLRDLWAREIYTLSSVAWVDSAKPYSYFADISDRDAVHRIIWDIQPFYIVHLAALGARNSWVQYSHEEMMRVNLTGTKNLIDAARDIGSCQGFLNISTLYEYGPQESPISENTIPHPTGDYALSKYAGTQYAIDQATAWFPIITYRLSSVYGPDDSERIIPILLGAFLAKKEIRLFDIHKKRDFIYISDLLDIIIRFEKPLKKNIKIMNIGSGESYSIDRLLRIISEILSVSIPKSISHTDEISRLHWEVDSSLLKENFDIKLISMKEGLDRIIQSYK